MRNNRRFRFRLSVAKPGGRSLWRRQRLQLRPYQLVRGWRRILLITHPAMDLESSARVVLLRDRRLRWRSVDRGTRAD
jgi:hypothetical protein